MKLRTLAAGAAVMLGAAAWAQETVPMTPLVQPGDLATRPAPKKESKPVYDESADARKQIDAAVGAAKKNDRRVLVQWGANWCGWCKLLHGLMESDGDIKKELLYEYDLVRVDVGRFDKNQDLVKKYGANIKGIPYLTVLDGDGKVVVNQDTGPLEAVDENGKALGRHDQAKVLAFLKDHEAAHVGARAVFDDGLALAKKEHKKVFLHFGAPWCGWCHRLENWMARGDVAPILGKDFVDVKIDQDRNAGAEDISKKFRKTNDGIPWFCILDENGKAIVTSDGPDGNIGFPGKPAEIEYFVGMVNKARSKMTEGDVKALRESLENDGKTTGGEG